MAWRVILAAAAVGVNACASVGGVAPAFQTRAWRTYLGSDQRAPAAADSLSPDPTPAWQAKVARGLVGSPALTEQLVVLAQVDQQVAVLDRATGKLLWRRGTGEYLGSGPLVDYDQVYMATQSGEGHVLALDLRNGKRLWTTRVGPTAAPLAADHRRVFAAGERGEVTALARSGGRQWRTRLQGGVRAAPLVAGPYLAVATTSDTLYLLKRDDGAVVARHPTDGAVVAAPALADGVILIGSAGGRLEACDTATLATRWSVAVGSGVVGAVAVRADTAWVLTDAGDLWRVPLAAPAQATKLSLGIVSRAAPTPVRGGTLVTGVDGRILLAAPTGATLWSTRIPTPVDQPVLVDGRFLLAVSKRGDVVAFR